MITSTDIANILFRDCKKLGIKTIPYGRTVVGELKSETIVIHSKRQEDGKIWYKSFAEINICVPDISAEEANTIRLNELERLARKFLGCSASTYDGTNYFYSIYSTGIEEDKPHKCHYVSVRILFEVLNVN